MISRIKRKESMILPSFWAGKGETLKNSNRKSIEKNKLSWNLLIKKYPVNHLRIRTLEISDLFFVLYKKTNKINEFLFSAFFVLFPVHQLIELFIENQFLSS